MDRATFCFTCGQEVTDPPRLSTLPDGTPCSACRERALALVPAALPARARVRDAALDDLGRELGYEPDAGRGSSDDDPPWSA